MSPTPDPKAGFDAALAAGFDRAWALLAAAPGDPGSGLRLPVVATASTGEPDARVMVVRAVDRAAHCLTVYTDSRAAKVAVLVAAPRVAVTGYDTPTRLQLRLHGAATIATTGNAVDAAWAALTAGGRTAYQSVRPPGTPVAQPPPCRPPGTPVAQPPPSPVALPDDGRANFAVVTIVLDRFEWLDLSVPGHRRAVHIRDGVDWRGTWLVP
ncbi:pyridoxamine 5'-phosphate oxidase family protein [Polymorphobacter sp. PAMC 29334]|uniref:pyridoxamine 5'-phosphate oxidase family protein n=1 Tax=Polymorphobacter sp. PAMC 29334 TaxID=2862331 RepID=UPI001C776C66|nr:pyridoxamine 5'-phosphate oxidase family protein [Polymorphobacter sp. PAMC 29334]QYE36291.1 pyridoxamine 5'-phosphate oxidase family protein [Polymorphobacter sp. PAMC 29334]